MTMPLDHDTLVAFSKSFGLFYLVVLSIAVLVYAFWPGNRKRFENAARNPVSTEEDRPWK